MTRSDEQRRAAAELDRIAPGWREARRANAAAAPPLTDRQRQQIELLLRRPMPLPPTTDTPADA